SGTLFDLELLPDEGPLMQEVADDEWRRRFYRADPVVVACALHLKVNPDRLLNWLKFCHRQPGLRILSPVAGRSWPALAADLARAFHQAAALWQKEAKEIRALLTSPGWAQGHQAKPAEQDEWLRAVEACCREPLLLAENLPGLDFCPRSRVVNDTRVDSAPPTHAFFDACEDLIRRADDFCIGLRIDFL